MIDLIKELGLEPDGIVGHSFGELACAYCDGSVTAQQAILAAYNRGKISIEANVDPGLMAAVGKNCFISCELICIMKNDVGE